MEISNRQTSLFTEEKLTYSQGGSLASHSAAQGSERERRTNATSGRRCLEQFERFNRHTLWAKTFAGLLIGTGEWYSTRCRLTWKLKATKSSRFYFQLAPSTLPTAEIASGLSLIKTPTKMDGEVSSGKKNPKSGDSGTLAQEIMSGYEPTMRTLGLLPTPCAMDVAEGMKSTQIKDGSMHSMTPTLQDAGKATKRMREDHQNNLTAIVFNLLPIPAARDYKGANTTEALAARGRLKEKADSLADQFHQTGKSSQLNPRFVSEMMGFPPNWTELPFLATEKKA